jgi:hypothetical protein
VYTTREEKLIASQFRLSDPHLNCLTRLVRQFELDAALCLALHDDSAGSGDFGPLLTINLTPAPPHPQVIDLPDTAGIGG